MVNKKTATRELSKQTEHDQTMYVTKQYILIEEMVLRTCALEEIKVDPRDLIARQTSLG